MIIALLTLVVFLFIWRRFLRKISYVQKMGHRMVEKYPFLEKIADFHDKKVQKYREDCFSWQLPPGESTI